MYASLFFVTLKSPAVVMTVSTKSSMLGPSIGLPWLFFAHRPVLGYAKPAEASLSFADGTEMPSHANLAPLRLPLLR
jgi:hypothetical protein